jgi:polyferredoxin
MRAEAVYAGLADAVLVLHFALVLFVILGVVAVLVGNRLGWRWVNHWWLRIAHALAIGIVVAQAWLGQDCPLTVLEQWLRRRSGVAGHDQSFIAYWLQRWLFYEAPAWVFVVAYTAFGALVAFTWWRHPPRRRG